jgi:hypothetical protein
MIRRMIGLLLAIVLSSQVIAQTQLEEAQIENDEGGAVYITGEANYTFPYFRMFLPRPFVLLYDVTGAIVDRDINFFPQPQSQTFGTITTDPFTSPFQYRLALPARPNAQDVMSITTG